MNFEQEYKQKLVTPEKAVSLVESGNWVDFGWCANTPDVLDKALAERTDELKDINLRGGVLLKPLAIFEREDAGEHFTWNSWHMSGIERKMIDRGCAYYDPMRYSEVARYYHDLPCTIDVAMFRVTAMDKHGFFNFGPNASHLTSVCENARKIVVEVNENLPYCLGGFANGVHISNVDYIVEGDNTPISELPSPPISDIDKDVAKLIISKIPDGACLQLGIGGMPNAVGAMIAESDLKDLGVHTEMYVDSFVDIAEAGKINGYRKEIDRARQVYAFGAGSKKMYDYLDRNPEMMTASVGYTNDIRTISSLSNFISINNAVDVDLFGQVNAESSGTRHISGSGGQLDFVLGAYLSPGGKSFMCCPSTYTAKDGQMHSRIRPILAPGSIVTTGRTSVQYIVTEYGIVNMKGRSTWQRAEGLISIAHPDFREELIAEAEKMKIWRRSNKR